MIYQKLRRVIKGQRGFTLIEIIAVLAITGLIGLGATTATVQMINQSSRNSDYTTASQHAMNAIYWISLDAQMSQTISTDGISGFPLTLNWTEWDNSEHEVAYVIVGDKLRRSYSIDGGEPAETVIAQYINPAPENTTCEFSDRVLTVKVTATVGNGPQTLSVTKVREITPRPGL